MKKILCLLSVAFVLLALLGSCDVLKQNIATSGPKKYKVEMENALLDIKRDIDEDGTVTDAHYQSFEKMMARWEGEMGKKGSYMAAKKVWDYLKKAKEDPGNAFTNNQEALGEAARVRDTLQTEVE